MNKKTYLQSVNGKSCTCSNNMYRSDYHKFLTTLKNSMEFTLTENCLGDIVTITKTGQKINIGKPAKIGKLEVKSNHVFACGIRIDISDIDIYDETGFQTVNGSCIKF